MRVENTSFKPGSKRAQSFYLEFGRASSKAGSRKPNRTPVPNKCPKCGNVRCIVHSVVAYGELLITILGSALNLTNSSDALGAVLRFQVLWSWAKLAQRDDTFFRRASCLIISRMPEYTSSGHSWLILKQRGDGGRLPIRQNRT